MINLLTEFKLPEIKPDAKEYRFVSKVVGLELSSIIKPCYRPRLIKYRLDLEKYTGVTKEKIKEFKNTLSSPYNKFPFFTDELNLLILIAILNNVKHNKQNMIKLYLQLLGLKYYTNQLWKHFKLFCDVEVWNMALDKVSSKHNFRVHNGIGRTILYLADKEYKNHKKMLSKTPGRITDKELIDLSRRLRNGVTQSTRSFAQLYYKLFEEKKVGVKQDQEGQELKLISQKISQGMCTYGQIDKEALTIAISKSGIRKEMGINIITDISTSPYRDQIGFIILLLGRLDKLKNICNDRNRTNLIRKAQSNNKIADKYIIKDKIKEILYSTPQGNKLKSIYEKQLLIFFLYYLTTFIRNRIC